MRKFTQPINLLFALFAIFFASAANSQTKVINVNLYGTASFVNAAWNNWQVTSSLTSPALKYTDGVTSSITSVLSAQQGYSDNGASYPVTMCPAQVGRDASYGTAPRTNTLNGLDNSKLYDIQLYASRGNSGQTTRFTINGINVDIATHINYTSVATFSNISPVGGKIVITLTNLLYYNYLNGFTLTEKPGTNQAPVASAGANKSITLPVNTVALTGTGTDADGTIASYAWSQVSGTAATIATPSAQNTNINGLTTAGVRVFRLTVTDNIGATATSDVTVTVNAGANTAPVANAGTNKSIQLPVSTVALTGTGTDADGTVASYAWSQVSGTAATISSPASQNTNITGLSTAGVRVFRLTVTDNQGATGTSDVTVTVNAANFVPVANGGGDKTIQLPVSSVSLSGSGTDADGTIASYAWSQVSGTAATISTPASQNTTITGLTTAGVRVFRLTVTDNQGATGVNDITVTVNDPDNLAPVSAAGTDQAIQLPVSTVSLTGSGTDADGSVIAYTWSQVSGTAATISTPGSQNTSITGLTTAGVRVFRLTVTDNDGATASDDVTVTVNAANQSPVATAGSNQSIQLPVSSVSLNGSATDADGTVASYSWSQISGTSAAIASPASASTTITGLTTAGVRVFRLTATDNQGATGTSDVTVTVTPANVAPVANGGGNKSITLPVTTVSLSGSGSDADGTVSSYAWSQLSGTSATINTANAAATSISGLTTAGVRMFRLTVTDNQGVTATDDVTVTVNPANEAPVAVAGANQSIQLPLSSVSLSGSATDADGSVVSYAWTQVSGTAATITTASSVNTTITGLSTAGVRVFRLTATDNQGATGTSDITITVTPANVAPVANGGGNKTITLPVNNVSLTGSGSDADGSVVSYAWSQVSGTASTITTPGAGSTTITGLGTTGVRVYRLTVTDNQGATGTSDVTVTVNAANVAPAANAGGNKSITLPVNSVSLTGSGTDTDGTIASYAWSQLSGTAATITSPAAAATTITGLTTAGVRVFRLTVTDNQGATATSDATVTVIPANAVPVVNAGNAQTITLPVSSVSLAGSATDADGTIASYAWTQVSGTAATISAASSQNTNITGLTTTGVRVFRLTATDNQGTTGFSDVTINVNAGSILDPADVVITFNAATPPTEPPYGTIGKWVRTKSLGWNSDDYKCYVYKGRQFRLKFPKTYVPGVNDGKKFPMLVFFHGVGEGRPLNTENEYQLLHGGEMFRDRVNSGVFDGYILAMQTPSSWGVAEYADIREIIDYMITNNKLDAFKIINNGLSGGAQGTWEMYLNNSTYIAGILPMSGVYSSFTNSSIVNQVKYTPIWNFHGGLDNSPAPYTAYQVRDAMAAAGARYQNTEYPTLGHGVWGTVWEEPQFWPYINSIYMSNPWTLYGRTEFCPGDAINVTVGLVAGLNEYQWRKDGNLIQGATGNTINVTSVGVYDARVRRGSIWSDWSRVPVNIKLKTPTVSPDIQISGLASRVFPAPDTTTGVRLEVPAGYASYVWQKVGSATTIGTSRFLNATSAGSYQVRVTEQFGCSSSFSNAFVVADANGPNKPDAASGLVVTTLSKTSLKLDWNNTPAPQVNETGFEIYQATQAGGPYTFIGMVGADVLTFQVNGLVPNTTYYYKVRAVSATAAAAVSNEASTITANDTQAPTTPGNLVKTLQSRTSIGLSWTASTDDVGVTRYDIYVDGTKAFTTTGTSFTVNALTPLQSYTFAVKAVDVAGNESPFSNQVSAVTVLNGLNYKHYTYTGSWPVLPDFNTLTPVVIGNMPTVNITNRVQNDNFGFLWEGFINITTAGNYAFRTNSDDGSKLYLGALNGASSPYSFGATAIVNNDGLHGGQDATSATIPLAVGVYPIAVTFYEEGGGEQMSASWSFNGGAFNQIPASAFTEVGPNNGSAPAAPPALIANAVAHNRIDLTWFDNSNNETAFEVWRSLSLSTGYSVVGRTAANTSSYSDTTLEAATTYYYKLKAIGQYGESPFVQTLATATEAEWNLNNNYTDASGGNKTLSATSSPTFDAADKKEGTHSLNLNGSSQYVSMPTTGSFLQTAYTQKSVVFWAKSASNTGNRFVFDIGAADDGLALRLDASRLYAGVAGNNSRTNISAPYTSTAWNHIAVVYNVNSLKLYVNGSEVAANNSLPISSVGSTSGNSRIGYADLYSGNAFQTLSPSRFSGKVDQFEIYNTALSASQVSNLMNGTTMPQSVATTFALPAAPAAPTAFVATAVSKSVIGVNWTDNAAGETGYELQRSGTTNSNYITIANLPANTSSYQDTALFPNSVFYYKVRAKGVGGNSAFATEDSAKTWNTRPVIAAVADRSARYGTATAISFSATDADGDALSFTIQNNPVFGTFADNGDRTATLTVSPSAAQQGVYSNIRIIVSDVNGGKDTALFNLTVNDNYDPAVTAIANVTMNEGATQNIALTATDQNAGDVLGWSVANVPDQFTLTPGANGSATLQLKPTFAAAGVYQVAVTVTDNNGGSSVRNFTLTVNSAEPSITKVLMRFKNNLTAPAPWNNITGLTTNNLKDDQNNTTGIGLAIQGSWFSTFSDGPNTGNNSGVYPDVVLREYFFFGQYPSTFTGPNSVTANITGLDPARKYDISFHGASVWGVQANNGTTTFTVGAQTIPLPVQNNTQGLATFTGLVPAANGTITFTTDRAPGTQVGYLNAIVITSVFDDGTAPVAPSNLTAVNDGESVDVSWQDVAYNETGYEVYRSATVDGAYSLVGQPAANAVAFTDNNVSGTTAYFYKVRAVNVYGNSPYSSVATVTTLNRAPVLGPVNDVLLKNNESVSINVSATDDAADLITLKATGLPSFATFTSNGNGTASISFNPTGAIGTYTATLVATDNRNGSSSRNFTISVVDKDVSSVHVNFTDGGVTLAPAPWNNFILAPYAGAAITNLKDDSNVNTGISVTLNNGFSSYINSGMNSNEGNYLYPESVVRTSIYDNVGTTRTITVGGLTPSKRYNFVFFNSNDNGIKSLTNFTINGNTVSLDAAYNTGRTVQINNITPNGSGQVVISVARAAGQDFAFLSSMVIQGYASGAAVLSPEYVRVKETKRTSVTLQWADRAGDETGYEIWRANSTNGSYALVTTVPANSTSYTNEGLSANTSYFYTVRTVRSGTYSQYSSAVRATTIYHAVYVNMANEKQSPLPWNNLKAVPQQGYSWQNFYDETGVTTNTSMVITKNFAGLYSAGMVTGNNSGVYPDNVIFDSYGLFPGESAAFKLSGLNLSMKYDLSFFGSTNEYGDVNTAFTINGKSIRLNTARNTSGIVTMLGVSPDVNGVITVGVAPGTPISLFGLLGAMVVKGYNEPVNTTIPAVPESSGVVILTGKGNQPADTTIAVAKTPAAVSVKAEPVEELKALSAYPNPFDQAFTLSIPVDNDNSVEVNIFNQTGQLVYANRYAGLAKGNNTVRIEANRFMSTQGLYVVKVTYTKTKAVKTFKLMKR